MIATRVAYGNALVALAKEDKRIVVLDADVAKSTGTLPVMKEVPGQFVNCGIAEQNMVCMGAGFAACGMIPFVTTFAVFTCMRAVEQVRNGVCYPNFSVKVVGTHAGLETGADGATHQAIEDLAIMRSLPNIKVLVPASPIAAEKMTRLAAYTDGPFYMRMGKDPSEELYRPDHEFVLGGSHELASGDDVAIIACGNMVGRSLEAAGMLAANGIKARVVDLYSIKPLDEDAIVRAAKETRGIVTVEDHSILGGLGGAVAEVVTELAPARIIRLGLRDVFGRSGAPADLYPMFGLTPAHIAEAAQDLMPTC